MREGRKKEASKVKQTNKAKQHSTPKAVTFPKKNELPQVGLEPTTLYMYARTYYQMIFQITTIYMTLIIMWYQKVCIHTTGLHTRDYSEQLWLPLNEIHQPQLNKGKPQLQIKQLHVYTCTIYTVRTCMYMYVNDPQFSRLQGCMCTAFEMEKVY